MQNKALSKCPENTSARDRQPVETEPRFKGSSGICGPQIPVCQREIQTGRRGRAEKGGFEISSVGLKNQLTDELRNECYR